MPFNTLLQKTGLVAILRGVKPDEIVAIGEKLYAAGFRLIEIPMNSPEALQSISILRDALPKDCLVGAGTVLSVEQVVAVKEAGGQII
ncbi:TPA: 2-dehydro-3-deoxy-6-phosphogalactonate aldolase, partial [Escherichia coli]